MSGEPSSEPPSQPASQPSSRAPSRPPSRSQSAASPENSNQSKPSSSKIKKQKNSNKTKSAKSSKGSKPSKPPKPAHLRKNIRYVCSFAIISSQIAYIFFMFVHSYSIFSSHTESCYKMISWRQGQRRLSWRKWRGWNDSSSRGKTFLHQHHLPQTHN